MMVRLENIIHNLPYFYDEIRGKFESGRYYCTEIRETDAVFRADSVDFENCNPEIIVPWLVVDYDPEKNKIVFREEE